MSTDPIISVIIPVFNGENFIDSCISNLDAQEFPDAEICFVVDHKTKDDTISKIEEQMKTHQNVRYIIQNDEGRLGFARNIGVENTAGKYIWFLDVDDKPFPDYIKDMVRTAEDTGSDMVMCNFYSSYNLEIPKLTGDYSVVTMDRLEALKSRASGKLPVTSWSMIFRRELIIDNSLIFRSGIAEDVDFTYRALNVSKKVSYNNKPLYLYYQNPNSICNAENENKRAYAELEVYEGLFALFEKDAEFYPYFKDRAIVSSMRCMGHFDTEEFMKNYRTNWVLKTLNEMGKKKPFPEVFIFRHFPKTYHYVIKTGLEKIYKDSLFDNSVSDSAFKKWFKKHFQTI